MRDHCVASTRLAIWRAPPPALPARRVDIPLACIGVMFLLIYAPRVLVLRGQLQAPEGHDNRHPRAQQARLEGAPQRANAAHANSFEAFAPFAAAVLICEQTGATGTAASVLSLSFIAARIAYPVLYVRDIPTARSAVWFVGMLAVIGLFILPWVRG